MPARLSSLSQPRGPAFRTGGAVTLAVLMMRSSYSLPSLKVVGTARGRSAKRAAIAGQRSHARPTSEAPPVYPGLPRSISSRLCEEGERSRLLTLGPERLEVFLHRVERGFGGHLLRHRQAAVLGKDRGHRIGLRRGWNWSSVRVLIQRVVEPLPMLRACRSVSLGRHEGSTGRGTVVAVQLDR